MVKTRSVVVSTGGGCSRCVLWLAGWLVVGWLVWGEGKLGGGEGILGAWYRLARLTGLLGVGEGGARREEEFLSEDSFFFLFTGNHRGLLYNFSHFSAPFFFFGHAYPLPPPSPPPPPAEAHRSQRAKGQ